MFVVEWSLLVILTSNVTERDRIAADVVRTTDGHVLSVTNAHIPFASYRLAVAPNSDQSELVFFSFKHSNGPSRWPAETGDDDDARRLSGPIPWGCVESAVYQSGMNRPMRLLYGHSDVHRVGASVVGSIISPVDEFIEWERTGWNQQRVAAANEFDHTYQSICQPLMGYIKEHKEELWNEWNITFDYVYTSLEDIIAVALRQGKMYRWDLHDTGNPEAPWTATEPFDTPIEGVFRILRAGKDLANLYIIDELGDIYVGFGPPPEHRKVGTVRDYHNLDRTVLTILFEDQQTEKIGILHVAEDGAITLPEITWEEEGHAADFMTEVDTDQTRAGIARLAEVLRQDANDARGE